MTAEEKAAKLHLAAPDLLKAAREALALIRNLKKSPEEFSETEELLVSAIEKSGGA